MKIAPYNRLAFAIFTLCVFVTHNAYAVCSNNEDGAPGQNGEIEYFTADNILRYCDGTDWIDMVEPQCPAGISSCGGDINERLVFTSSFLIPGSLGGINGADSLCQSDADTNGLNGTYYAWLADSSISPATRFEQPTVNYVMVDGTIIANGWTDLTDGTLDNNIDIEANNITGAINGITSNVATDGTAIGTAGTDHCDNFTNTSTTLNRGDKRRTNSQWTDILTDAGCSLGSRLYCFEQSSLLGHWKLDETSGTTATDSGSLGNDGTYNTIVPSTDFEAGKVDTAIEIDTSPGDGNNRIDIPTNAAYGALTEFTIGAWVKPEDLSGTSINGIIDIENIGIFYFPFNRANIEFSSQGWSVDDGFWRSSGEVNDNVWSHIAMTYDTSAPAGTDPILYINGEAQSFISFNDTDGTFTPPASSALRLGSIVAGGTNRPLDGELDDVRLYNRTLSPSEIQTLATCTNPGSYYYNASDDVMQWCDGVNSTNNMHTPASGSGGCTSPTAPEGSLNYDTDRYKACDGNGWIDIGK